MIGGRVNHPAGANLSELDVQVIDEGGRRDRGGEPGWDRTDDGAKRTHGLQVEIRPTEIAVAGPDEMIEHPAGLREVAELSPRDLHLLTGDNPRKKHERDRERAAGMKDDAPKFGRHQA